MSDIAESSDTIRTNRSHEVVGDGARIHVGTRSGLERTGVEATSTSIGRLGARASRQVVASDVAVTTDGRCARAEPSGREGRR